MPSFHITEEGTFTLQSAGGATLQSITVNTAGDGATITVYDSPTDSGTELAVITPSAPVPLFYGTVLAKGLTIVVATAACDITVVLGTGAVINVTQGGGSGTPSDTVSGPDDFGADASPGSSDEYSRGDHDHGLPALSPSGSVQWVDLGMVDLVSAIMDGPTTLYDMPEGSFLKSISATDDPDTVSPDSMPVPPITGNIDLYGVGFGTVKSFGWTSFAFVSSSVPYSFEDGPRIVSDGQGYGPFAALDTGIGDETSLVLSAAAVGPIQCALWLGDMSGYGAFVRVAAITAWAAAINYDSPASNTVATPGVLQKCAILANGTIWINGGTTGMSGGSAPDFAGNAGGSTSDGGTAASVTADAPPTLPTTIITGTNDTFMLNAETFTLAAGVLTTEADAIAAMGAALGSTSGEAFSTLVTPSDSGGSILATAVLPGPIHNGATITEGNGAAAVLGFTGNPDTFVGGTGIVWYDTTSPPPTVGQVHVVVEIVTPVSP